MIKIKVKFIVFTIATFTFAYLSGGSLPWSIFYATILILLFGLIHILIERLTTNVYIDMENHSFSTGDEIKFSTIVNSLCLIPASYLYVSNEAIRALKKNYNGDVIILNTSKQKVILNEFTSNIRGIYDISVTKVVFTDLLSIIKSRKSFKTDKSIKIYPQIYNINEKCFDGRSIFQNSSRSVAVAEESNEVRDYRKYIAGDSLKRVNWKLSAKHNEIYVKNFSEVISKDSNIFLNMVEQEVMEEYPGFLEEQMIEFCVSLVSYLQSKKVKTKLFINNSEEKYFTIGSCDEFQLMMEYFLENKSKGNRDLGILLDSKLKNLEVGSWIGIITLKIDQALKRHIKLLINAGFKISVFYCIDKNLELINDYNDQSVEFIKCEKAMSSNYE